MDMTIDCRGINETLSPTGRCPMTLTGAPDTRLRAGSTGVFLNWHLRKANKAREINYTDISNPITDRSSSA